MPKLTVVQGESVHELNADPGVIIGEVLAHHELPVEQPCAGRGTCGKCKILDEGGLDVPDEIERKHLTEGELAVGNRLACRARIKTDAQIAISPIVVYSNKIFKSSNRYRIDRDVPLGIAVDLGSTTVAAFLTMLDDGEVCVGGASLNQQTVYGADVISRLNSAYLREDDAHRLHRLALSSITQAIDSLNLSAKIRQRVERVTIVSNPAMHHLLIELPVQSLAVMPFQPHKSDAILNANSWTEGIFPENAQVNIPPLIGGFVGSDALACLTYFDFDTAGVPMAAIDLGTNGEVMVTDGETILTASTAAGPAFEGVNISCGSRAVDGAITQVEIDDNLIRLITIADEEPVGLTGSGLLSAVHQMRKAGWIEPNGRINPESPKHKFSENGEYRELELTPDGRLSLNQWDVRELQKAKGAIRAAIEILMQKLDLEPDDIQRLILTGSFGGQVDIDAVIALGMIPPVKREVVFTIANGAGYGAAIFLSDDGFQRGIDIANRAQQIDLDMQADFINKYVEGMELTPRPFKKD